MSKFANNVVSWIDSYIRNSSFVAILVKAAEQNVPVVRSEITQYVAKIESWGETDHTSYANFELAKQTLYLKYSILIDVHQKEMSHPDWSFVDIDISGYNKLFYDHELNATDPYFDTIKRDYYNEVSS